MKPNSVTIFIAAFFLLCQSAICRGANPVVHISAKPAWINVCKPYDKHPSLRDVENGYFFALVERQIDVDRQADYRHNIREIISEAGIQNGSEVNISFDPSYERLDFHEIVVWRNGKKQNRLHPADFKVIAAEEDFSKFIYQGSYTANYIIPDVQKGDKIEYSYTVTGRNPVFNGKYCQTIYLQWGQLIGHQYVSLQSSSSRKLNIKAFNSVPKQSATSANGKNQYIWEDFMVKPGVSEKNEPEWYNTYARIQISEFNNWAEVVNWAMKVNPVSGTVSGELASRVAKLKAEAGGDKEKYFRLAVKLAQDEVRYMGIEIGEYSHRANRPENVFKQRYGDCKDKALLLASILRANGIEAYMVLVNTGLQDKVAELLPTTGAFNHAVTVATINGKQVWIDATIAYQRGKGADLYFPNYGKGLVLKDGNTDLVDIPASKTGKVTSREKYTVTKVSDKVKLDIVTIYTLNEADDVRSQLASSGLHSTEQSYRKYYAGTYPKIEVRDSLIVRDNEDKNELTTIEAYLIPDFFKKDSLTGKYTVTVYADGINNRLPAITGETQTPVALNYPYSANHTIEVVLPTGWDVPARDFAITRDAYSFKSDYSTNGNSLLLHYQFSFLKDFIPVSQLAQARDDLRILKDKKLAYSFSYLPGAVQDDDTKGPVNVWMIGLVVLAALVSVALAIWLYHIETPAIVFTRGATFQPIGGWLILIAIGLSITPFKVLKTMADSDYFNANTWHLYEGRSADTAFKSVLVWETAGNTIIICTAVFCLVLLLKKRDILPRVITFYFLFGVTFTLIDYVFALSISDKIASAGLYELMRTIVIAVIWVPYFRISNRVHETFIVPYPAHNFSYEEFEKNGGIGPA